MEFQLVSEQFTKLLVRSCGYFPFDLFCVKCLSLQKVVQCLDLHCLMTQTIHIGKLG